MTPADQSPEGQRESAGQDPLCRLFAGPTDEDRAQLRVDLLTRATLVRTNGWESYRRIWSTGEVVGVAVVLGKRAELAALGETEQSALERWAFDLWGLDSGQADVDNGCKGTRQWFRDAAVAFTDALRSSRRPDSQTLGGEG